MERPEGTPTHPQTRSDGELVRALYPGLRRFAAVVAPPNVDPDDLLQEAIVRALRLRPLSELEDAGTYLRRTMVNVATNARRRFGRQRRALARVPLIDSERPTYPSDLTLLLTVAPPLRAALYLAAVEGKSYAEIGVLLGCSEAAARARASRARRLLRIAMESIDD